MYSFEQIAWMFLIYAMIGWLWETPFVSIKKGKFVNRGFLRGPIIPIYGFAITTIMISLKAYDDLIRVTGWHRVAAIMLYAAFVATVWEYVTSYLLEVIFKTRWWDYSPKPFNIKGRIALHASIFWGIGSTILWFYVNHGLMAFYERVPIGAMRSFLAIAYAIVLVDVAFTLVELVNLRSLVNRLHHISDEMFEGMTERLEKLGELHFIETLEEAKNTLKSKVVYRKYEGFQAFSEFLEELTSKSKDWAIDNDMLSGHFREVLGKIKGNVRFFRNYPDARTKHFQMVFIARKAIQDFFKQFKD